MTKVLDIAVACACLTCTLGCGGRAIVSTSQSPGRTATLTVDVPWHGWFGAGEPPREMSGQDDAEEAPELVELMEVTRLKDKPFLQVRSVGPQPTRKRPLSKAALRREVERTVPPTERYWSRYIAYPFLGFPRDIAALVVDTAQYPAACVGFIGGMGGLGWAMAEGSSGGSDLGSEGGKLLLCSGAVGAVVTTVPFGLVSGALRAGSGGPPMWVLGCDSEREHFFFPHLNTWQFKTIDRKAIKTATDEAYAKQREEIEREHEEALREWERKCKEKDEADAWNESVREELSRINTQIQKHNPVVKAQVAQLSEGQALPYDDLVKLVRAYNRKARKFNKAARKGTVVPLPNIPGTQRP